MFFDVVNRCAVIHGVYTYDKGFGIEVMNVVDKVGAYKATTASD